MKYFEIGNGVVFELGTNLRGGDIDKVKSKFYETIRKIDRAKLDGYNIILHIPEISDLPDDDDLGFLVTEKIEKMIQDPRIYICAETSIPMKEISRNYQRLFVKEDFEEPNFVYESHKQFL